MKDPKVIDSKVVFGPARLCYVSVMQRKKFDGDTGEGKYSTNILIPKGESATVEAINKAIAAARSRGITAKWGGKLPKKLGESPMRDGDEKEDDVFGGHWYLNAKTDKRPLVLDVDGSVVEDPEAFYSGVWALASVSFYPYSTGGNNGVACALNALRKVKDGDRLGGGDSSHDFDDLCNDDDL